LKGSLSIVGLGLYDEQGISLRGLAEAKDADLVYLELYTSLMPAFSKESLERLIGKRVIEVSRSDLEEDAETGILRLSHDQKVCLLVPGDPFVATTHVSLRIAAEKAGIPTRVIHAASIASAIPGAIGLQSYKFGRSVSIPFPQGTTLPETPYIVIRENKIRGLHTLVFLDIDLEDSRFMSISEALSILFQLEERRREKVVEDKTLAVGIARLGSPGAEIYAGKIGDLLDHEFGAPPHVIVFPGDLHFLEREALKAFAHLSCESS
jgi:diphthine synthase